MYYKNIAEKVLEAKRKKKQRQFVANWTLVECVEVALSRGGAFVEFYLQTLDKFNVCELSSTVGGALSSGLICLVTNSRQNFLCGVSVYAECRTLDKTPNSYCMFC